MRNSAGGVSVCLQYLKHGKDKETERELGNDLSGNDIRCCRRFQNKHSHNKNTAPILAGLGTWALL